MSTVMAVCLRDIKASLHDERQQTGRNRRKEEAAIAPTKRRAEGLKRNRNDEEERKCQMQGWEIDRKRERENDEREKKESGPTRGEREREEEIGACKSTMKARNLNSLCFTMIAVQKSQSLPSRFARVIAVFVAITAFDNDVARRLFH
ncbi:hypothetical protein ALC53_12318 [Atta colombica]|uniref:Uncharacterized protein n=1 Tax=Atta colombica TaxID=520822 RepID=A0A195AZ72_9HYME|nr:hypothetical protein ALC53_12318 [Atta colombica]